MCDGASVVYRTKYYPEKKKNCEVAVKADTKRFLRSFWLSVPGAYGCGKGTDIEGNEKPSITKERNEKHEQRKKGLKSGF